MSETELIERLKELKEEGAILGEDEVKILLNLIENSVSKDKIRELLDKYGNSPANISKVYGMYREIKEALEE